METELANFRFGWISERFGSADAKGNLAFQALVSLCRSEA